MSLADEYRRQLDWRAWATVFAELPPLGGQSVLDLGCAIGDQAAELAARGARVIGVDANEELLGAARSRGLANVEFRAGDLRALPDPGAPVDGLWCSFAAAYFPDLPPVLAAWGKWLRPGAWVALTEIDDLFGHEPVGATTRSLLEAYAREASTAGRYDFQMGRKLPRHLERAGFTVAKTLTLDDEEFAFDGPARPEVVEAWRLRFERMRPLRDFCGARFERLRDEFLRCLGDERHRAAARVICCIATR